MVGFLKAMTISACLLLAGFIWLAGSNTFKETTADKVVRLIIDAYAVGLIYTAVKILMEV